MVTGALAIMIFACEGEKKADPQPGKAKVTEPCTTDGDCVGELVCLAQECTDSSRGAVYGNPRGAVTPDKVKRHVDDIKKKAADRADKSLDIE